MDYTHDNCWFKKVCKLNQCDEPICLRFEHMLDMLKRSGLKDFELAKNNLVVNKYDYFAFNDLEQIQKEDLKNWYQSFHSLYIWSKNFLNGKTSWAVKLLHSYFILWVDYQFSSYPCGYFININQLKNIFKDQVQDPTKWENINHDLYNAELLVIDDIDLIVGEDKLEKYLSGVLDERYKAQKSVIFTSHYSPEEFKQKTNNGYLSSRIIDLSKHIEFKSPSYTKEVK